MAVLRRTIPAVHPGCVISVASLKHEPPVVMCHLIEFERRRLVFKVRRVNEDNA